MRPCMGAKELTDKLPDIPEKNSSRLHAMQPLQMHLAGIAAGALYYAEGSIYKVVLSDLEQLEQPPEASLLLRAAAGRGAITV